jgi:coenzyme F420-reducing hydrogenase gamma subunit
MSHSKPTIAVYKFSSCDGCQLSILNLEDELLALADAVDIAYFLEATRAQKPGPYDIAIVEGSVTTPHEIERIKDIRQKSAKLIALGTCATSGGIQALRNFTDADELANAVYDHPEYLHYLKTATPIAEHVHVDFEI